MGRSVNKTNIFWRGGEGIIKTTFLEYHTHKFRSFTGWYFQSRELEVSVCFPYFFGVFKIIHGACFLVSVSVLDLPKTCLLGVLKLVFRCV